jgi:multidrug efflux pump
MISRFFIDRPIFATVLSVVITLTGLIALFFLPVAQYPRITPPGVSVSISYPGASAQVVAATVGAPIEQQVNGIEGMLYMSSQSGNDGTYTLTVTFDIGTDVNTALVMVQNRVALAMQQLPTAVQNQGITIRKRTPDILCVVSFFSPNNRYDDIYLSNFATIFVKDELLRTEGVSDITYLGERDYSIRAWLDPRKLAARNMTAMDVARAIAAQNVDAPAGQVGQPPAAPGQTFQLPVDTLGRLSDPDQFADIVVKVGGRPPVLSPTGILREPSPAGGGASAAGNSGMPSGSGPMGASTSRSGSSGSTGSSTRTTGIGTGGGTTGSSTSGGTTSGGTTTGGTTPDTTTTGGGATSGGASGGGTTGAGPASGTGVNTNIGPPSTGLTQTGIAESDVTAGGTVGANVLTGGALGQGPPSPASGLVRLRNVARVERGAQNYNLSCTIDGRPSVGLAVFQLPGTNALDVGERVRAKMEELKKRFPDGVDYRIAYDTTPYIRDSIADVLKTLIEAVAIVGMVVLIFLQDWRAMILPMIDVPVSIIGTFTVMALVGFSLNNISLFGLVLAIGIVVDDAIVVLENIERQIAKGYDARTASLKAMDEVTGPIIAVALVLCAVFVPCAFIGGITGQFFRQFAVTIAVSTLISALNAITMTPSRAVLLFKTEEGGEVGRESGEWRVASGEWRVASGEQNTTSSLATRHSPLITREALPWWIFGVVGGLLTVWLGPDVLAEIGLPTEPAAEDGGEVPAWLSWAVTAAYFLPGALAGGVLGWFVIRPVNAALGWFFRAFNHFFDRTADVYGWGVGKLLHVSAVVLVVYGGLLFLTWWVLDQAPRGFIPQQDQGRLIVGVQLPDSASLERTKKTVALVEKIAHETPGVAHTVAFAGMSFLLQANSSNFASMFVVLDPFDERQRPELRDTAIMARLRREWARRVKDGVVTVFGAAPIPGLGVAGGYKFIVEDRGDLGLRNLQSQVQRLVGKIQSRPGLTASSQFRSHTPQVFLDVDRTKAASLGVAINDVNQTLNMYLGSLYVNSYNEFGRHWQVTIQAESNARDRVEDINLYQVRNNAGQMVPLGTLVKPREIGGPISVTRYNLYTATSVSGNMRTGVSTGEAIGEIEKLADESLPLSMKADWTELMFLQKRAGNTAMWVFALSVISVFLALAALYESWPLPLAVILVVPLCLLCSVAGVLFNNRDVNIFVQIGLVVLVGLACKNAILIVEFGQQLTKEGRSRFEATQEASRLRLRPILMTSFAFIFGVVPLVLASGAGAEMRRSLGTAVFSGMLGVTLFGIFLTPIFFYVIQGLCQTRLFQSQSTQAVLSYTVGGGLGLAIGFCLAQLGIGHWSWASVVGGCVGILVVRAVREIQRRMGPRSGRGVAG